MKKDYYAVLGISKNASKEEIGSAYRKIALESHPDRNPSPEAAERFKEAAEAYSVLSNDEKRTNYDRFGQDGAKGSHFGIDPFSVFGDLFGDFHTMRPSKGPDYLESVIISLEQAYNGCEVIIKKRGNVACDKCEGTGAESFDTCSLCFGKGKTVERKGPFTVVITCAKCRGEGKFSSVQCKQCNGSGCIFDKETEHLIQVPPGIENESHIVLHGKGEAVPNGDPGDLICLIKIEKHPGFNRKSEHLFCDIPITFAQAVLGHKISIPFFNNKVVDIVVPPRTTSESVLKIYGKGMPIRQSGFGNLYAKVIIQAPENPDAEYLNLVKKLATLDDKQQYQMVKEFGCGDI